MRFRVLNKLAALMTFMIVPAFYGNIFSQIRIIPQAQLDSASRVHIAPDLEHFMKFDSLYVETPLLDENGAPYECELSFTNCSDEPYLFADAVSSCSCLRLDFQRTNVLPGQKVTIRMRYYPKGHPGNHDRRIMIYTSRYRTPSATIFFKTHVK